MTRLIRLGAAVVGGVLCACSPAPSSPPTPGDLPTPALATATLSLPGPAVATPTPPPTSAPIPTLVPPDPVQEAVLALAEALNIPAEDITVAGLEPVEWADSSLGCPRPGNVYLPVVTPGYALRLFHDGKTYEVHTDLAGTVVLCFDPGEAAQGGIPDPLVAEFIELARANLVEQLGIPDEEIALVRSEAAQWSDSSIGCREEGQQVVPAITYGYRVILAVGEVRYEYHTDQQRIIFCATPTE